MNEQQELHDSVVAWVSRINESWQGTVRNIVETGKALIDAKADLPHGAFTEMVETDLFFSTRTAQRLMAIAEHPSLSNPTHVSVLPASWGTLYELSKIDGCTVEKLIQAGWIYPELERKDISALLPPPKTKAKAKKTVPPRRRPSGNAARRAWHRAVDLRPAPRQARPSPGRGDAGRDPRPHRSGNPPASGPPLDRSRQKINDAER